MCEQNLVMCVISTTNVIYQSRYHDNFNLMSTVKCVNLFAISWYAALSRGKDGNYNSELLFRDFSNLFRSAANMSVLVVIRGIRTRTVAGISIIAMHLW
jgi:hypothetical protein